MVDKQVSRRAVQARKKTRQQGRAQCGALAVALALACATMPLAAQAQSAPVAISIPAQPLGDALIELGEQASLVIFYLPETVRGATRPRCRGG